MDERTPKTGLHDWREQCEAIFSNLPVGISYLTPDMRYIRINPFLEKKLGKKSSELEGKFCYEVNGMYKDDPARTGREKICDVCGVSKALETGQPFKFVRRVRDDFVVENIGVPVTDKDGAVMGAVEIVVDISERVAMEERLQRHAAELEAAVEEKTRELYRSHEEFLTMLTHDMKTPLTTIIGYSAILLGDGRAGVDDNVRASVEGIRTSAERILNLVRNFLSAGKIQARMLSISPRPARLDSIVLESLRSMEPMFKEKDLSVEVDLDPALPRVAVDREHMERVLSNLLSNAVKFTSAGGRICLNAYGTEDGFVHLEIQDTGTGIPDEELPLLFDKYYQGANKTKGTGLGLFIAKNIVEAHKGDILVSSVHGHGTTFTVRLPRTS